MPKENNTTQMNDFVKPNEQSQVHLSYAMARNRTFKNDFVKPKDQRELALFGLARTEGVARAVPSSLGHCRVVTEEDKSNRAFKSTYIQAIKLTLILVTLALTACRSSHHASKDDTMTVPPSSIVSQPDNATAATDETSNGKCAKPS